jgi:membrane peptidoglycan carboxypeptidase
MKIVKYAMLLLLLALCIGSAYSFFVVIQARDYTEKVVSHDFEAGVWRSPGETPRPILVKDSDLSPEQRRILLLVQDPGFQEHGGIDLSTPGAGLTTLTQAIVKKIYFGEFKPGFAKLKQSLIAFFAADPKISKSDQITLFLNTMYLGKVNGIPVTGFGEGAKAFYGKSFSELDEDEFIGLVASVISPNTFHMIDHPEWHADRVGRIKTLASGEYAPKGLLDQYYGPLSEEIITAGIPPVSYRSGYFEQP